VPWKRFVVSRLAGGNRAERESLPKAARRDAAADAGKRFVVSWVVPEGNASSFPGLFRRETLRRFLGCDEAQPSGGKRFVVSRLRQSATLREVVAFGNPCFLLPVSRIYATFAQLMIRYLLPIAGFVIFLVEQAPAQTAFTQTPQPTPRSAATPSEGYAGSSAVAYTTSMDVLDDKRALNNGDRVSLRIVEDPDIKEPVQMAVTDSGEMDIPHIGRVNAAGKTPKQLAYEIKAKLEAPDSYFHRATVILGLDSISAKSRGTISVTGQVRNPRIIEIPPGEDLTVSEAVMAAGGFADFANKRKVYVARKTPTGQERIKVDLVDVIEKGDLSKDMVLQAGDVVYVGERLINF
jgi:polysaccharide biosynthesis/export protein